MPEPCLRLQSMWPSLVGKSGLAAPAPPWHAYRWTVQVKTPRPRVLPPAILLGPSRHAFCSDILHQEAGHVPTYSASRLNATFVDYVLDTPSVRI